MTASPATPDRPAEVRRRILVATRDVLTQRRAGPAIRAWKLATALAEEHDVTLVSDTAADVASPLFAVEAVDRQRMGELVAWAEIIVFQGWVMASHPEIAASDKVVVCDVYDPLHLEQLEQTKDLEPPERRRVVGEAVAVLNQQLARGDFFLCASPKQRDLWIGQLSALGRVNTAVYDDDGTLYSLIDVVPFGVDEEPPAPGGPALRGVVPGIGPDDKVILWGGGVYNWFDPLTLLRAVDRLRKRMPEVRLYFMGLRHPNPEIPAMRMATAAVALSDELGLTGTHVFFNDGWVAYEDRGRYLLEADVGVSTHLDHVETAFSFRTRILDYLWAGMPVVATTGDSFAEFLEVEGAGLVVPPDDVEALEEALYALLSDPERAAACAVNSRRLAARYHWSAALEPLVRFCRNPRRAPDLVDPELAPALSDPVPRFPARRPPRLVSEARIALGHLREGGVRQVASKANDRVRRQLGQRRARR